MREVRSSASTPSLRSRDGVLPPHMRMDAGGNVRVVVRVRAFLPRGMLPFFFFLYYALVLFLFYVGDHLIFNGDFGS